MDDLMLYGFIRNELSEEEIAEVLDWLDADPANQKYFDGLDRMYSIAGLNEPAVRRPLGRTIPLRRKIVARVAWAAAVVGLCLGLSYLTAAKMYDRRARSMTRVFVPNGERMRLTLGDGTSVWLNSGTTLEYPSVFARAERRVKISGEAMFDVVSDPAHPFVVETFAYDVRVLGTRFNVEADERQGVFATSLLRGKVRIVSRSDGKERITMLPDQRVRLENDKLLLDSGCNADGLLWTEGILSITGLTFEQVIGKFERAFDVKIVVACDELPQIKFQRCKLRVSDGIDHALGVLQHAADFDFEHDTVSNTVYLR